MVIEWYICYKMEMSLDQNVVFVFSSCFIPSKETFEQVVEIFVLERTLTETIESIICVASCEFFPFGI